MQKLGSIAKNDRKTIALMVQKNVEQAEEETIVKHCLKKSGGRISHRNSPVF